LFWQLRGPRWVLEIPSSANQSVVGIYSTKDLPYEYLLPTIENDIPKIIGLQTGGAQQYINKGNIENYEF
jgi:hypothetical protein